jgi:hypothetical protein
VVGRGAVAAGHRADAAAQGVTHVTPLFARGFRAALVTGAATGIEAGDGPAVIVVDANGQVAQASIGAAARVAELGAGPLGHSPLPMGLRNLVGSARTTRRDGTPRCPGCGRCPVAG